MANKYSWSCRTQAEIIRQDNVSTVVRVHCYWKADEWSHHMSPIYGWVTCDGKEELVYNGGWIDTRNDWNALVELGYHDFTVSKGYSARNVRCSARNRSNSSYASGERYSDGWNVGIDAKLSYTVSYNANGGSGAPGNQTKWYDETLTLSENRPSRDGHDFLGWATSSGGNVAYQPGNNYNSNSGATLYAKWKAHTYTVSYNANGGSGAPGSQTKIYGQNLTLSSVKPTRTNYNFLGWSTSPDGGVNYKSGATYTSNSKVTLYAVWQLAYKAPRISGFDIYRCTSNGTPSETGTYLKYIFNWETDKSVSSIRLYYKLQNAESWTSISVTASGTKGTVNKVYGDGKVSSESSYVAKAHVQDSGGTTYSSELSIGTASFPIDIRKGGKGVAIGKVAEEDIFDVGMNAKFRGKVEGIPKVINNLTSASTTDSLSAYQGKILNDRTTNHYMHAWANRQRVNIPRSWSITPLPLNNSEGYGNKFRISGNKIIVGKGIHKTRINASIGFNNLENSGDKQLVVTINGKDVLSNYVNGANAMTSGWRFFSIPYRVVNVKENDYIQIGMISGTVNTFEFLSADLVVEFVE